MTVTREHPPSLACAVLPLPAAAPPIVSPLLDELTRLSNRWCHASATLLHGFAADGRPRLLSQHVRPGWRDTLSQHTAAMAHWARACTTPEVLDVPEMPEGIGLCAGIGVRNDQGQLIGSLCVLRAQARPLSATQRQRLLGLARMAAVELAGLGGLGVPCPPDADPGAQQDATHLFKLVLDSLPARISYWDAERRLRFANTAFLRDFRLPADDFAGRTVDEVLGPAWLQRIQVSIELGLTGRHVQLETSFQAPDGQELDMDLRFTPDQRNGQVHGLFVIALDISARRRAERGLAEQDMRFKLLVDGVRDYAIFMLDARGHIATWNANAMRIHGYEASQVIGQHIRLFFPPEARAVRKPETELQHAAEHGCHEGEDWHLTADGSRKWVGVLLTALRDNQGQLIGYAKITRDLTERRRQQLMFDRVVELAPCAMLMADAQGRIVMANAQAERTFGLRRAELLGTPIAQRLPGILGKTTLTLKDEHGIKVHHDLRAVRGDGQELGVDVRLSPIESPDGMRTLATVLDLTEVRAQQTALMQALAEKETLLKEVYHRVKNNLQVIQSLLSLQRRTVPEGPVRHAIDDTVQRVASMALVHEKLYRSEHLSVLSLPDYTQDLMRQLGDATGAGQRGIAMHADIFPIRLGIDSAIPYGLLLTELVSNCLKHAFRGREQGNVWVTLAQRDGGPELTVRDDGIGLPLAQYQAQRGSMGLRLAQALAGQLGGQLDIQACEPGVAFRVQLATPA